MHSSSGVCALRGKHTNMLYKQRWQLPLGQNRRWTKDLIWMHIWMYGCVNRFPVHFSMRTIICRRIPGRLLWRCLIGVLFWLCACTYTPPTMHHHGDQVVQPLRIGGVPGGVEEAKLQGEDDSIGQLGVPLQLLHVLKALQVQSQYHWQFLYTHPVSQTLQSDAISEHRTAPTAHSGFTCILTSCVPPAYFYILHSSICIRCTVSLCYWNLWEEPQRAN